MNTITKLSASIISVDPDDQFPRFFKFAVSKFRHFYHSNPHNKKYFLNKSNKAGNEHEEEVDHTLIWYASFIADIVRGASGDVLIKHRKEIDEIMAFLMQFKAPNIYKVFFFIDYLLKIFIKDNSCSHPEHSLFTLFNLSIPQITQEAL